jgi:glutamyl-tRNA reductase
MLNSLNLWNYHTGAGLPDSITNECFVLRTCQRTILLSFNDIPTSQLPKSGEYYRAEEAYAFLLETICGLKSKLLGENEIVGQFKNAYQEFIQQPHKDKKLLVILEKLFKDTKDIRTQHLIGVGQKTYASIARKHLLKKNVEKVLILGTGELAEDLILQLKKKVQVSITGRNLGRVTELAIAHNLQIVPFENKALWLNFSLIANTIGFEGTLLDHNWFEQWINIHSKRLLVDLAEPSPLKHDLHSPNELVTLADIFAEGAILEDHKHLQLQRAKETIQEIVKKREKLFENKLHSALKYQSNSTSIWA